jgi:hypothetical protein
VTANGDGDAPLREVAPLAELVPVTKITANLPENLAQGLRDYARSSGTTFTQSLKEAISLKLYVERLVREGATIVVEQPGQRKRELVFHL